MMKLDVAQSRILFDRLKNYDDLCIYNYYYCHDLVKYSPGWDCSEDRKNLYEIGDNIQFYMGEFNKHGYFTICSQPSLTTSNVIQYAFVTGFISKKLAEQIYEDLKNDEHILMSCGHFNNNHHEKNLNKFDMKADSIAVTKKDNAGLTWFPLDKYSSTLWERFPHIDLANHCHFDVAYLQSKNDEYMFRKLSLSLQKHSKMIEIV